MAFYIRKSIRFGPLGFNLSKSGVGMSVGSREQGFRQDREEPISIWDAMAFIIDRGLIVTCNIPNPHEMSP